VIVCRLDRTVLPGRYSGRRWYSAVDGRWIAIVYEAGMDGLSRHVYSIRTTSGGVRPRQRLSRYNNNAPRDAITP
jgi:hypothetical protein